MNEKKKAQTDEQIIEKQEEQQAKSFLEKNRNSLKDLIAPAGIDAKWHIASKCLVLYCPCWFYSN